MNNKFSSCYLVGAAVVSLSKYTYNFYLRDCQKFVLAFWASDCFPAFPITFKRGEMVPGKGKYANISKGKGAANTSKGSSTSKLKEVKKEKISEAEESEEDDVSTLVDVRPFDYHKLLPRFTSSIMWSIGNEAVLLNSFACC